MLSHFSRVQLSTTPWTTALQVYVFWGGEATFVSSMVSDRNDLQ